MNVEKIKDDYSSTRLCPPRNNLLLIFSTFSRYINQKKNKQTSTLNDRAVINKVYRKIGKREERVVGEEENYIKINQSMRRTISTKK
jgi:hypothetical protein